MEPVLVMTTAVIIGSSNMEFTKTFTYIEPGTYNSNYISVKAGMIVTTTSGKPVYFPCGIR